MGLEENQSAIGLKAGIRRGRVAELGDAPESLQSKTCLWLSLRFGSGGKRL